MEDNKLSVNHDFEKLLFIVDSIREINHDEAGIGIDASQISIAQIKTMKAICQSSCKGLMLKEIAEKIKLTPSAASQAVDALVKSNILERYQNEKDRRAVSIKLSSLGEKMRKHYLETVNQQMADLLSIINPQEQKLFSEILSKLAERLKK